MEASARRVSVVAPGAGELVGERPGRRVEILSDRDPVHVTLSRFGPGMEGADLHVHRRHSDFFYVLEGELTVRLGVEDEQVVGARRARSRGSRRWSSTASATRRTPTSATSTSTLPDRASRTTCARCATAASSPTTSTTRPRTGSSPDLRRRRRERHPDRRRRRAADRRRGDPGHARARERRAARIRPARLLLRARGRTRARRPASPGGVLDPGPAGARACGRGRLPQRHGAVVDSVNELRRPWRGAHGSA